MGYLIDMLPTRAANDPLDGAFMDTEFGGQFDRVRIAVARSTVAAANFCHLCFGQLATGYTTPTGTIGGFAVASAALANLVLGVFVLSAKPKVRRVDAGGIVAIVTDAHSFGNGAAPELPGVPMSPYRLVSMEFEQTVTGPVVFGGEPNPTAVRSSGLVDMGIKPLGGWRYSWGHHRAPISVIGPRLLAAARGHFVPEIIAASGA